VTNLKSLKRLSEAFRARNEPKRGGNSSIVRNAP
jgi:hypothetical protein